VRRMKARDLFIICLALVVSISVAIATRYILRGGSETTASVTKVMVASGDLQVGKRLDKSSYRWQEWPTGTLQPVYITEGNKQVAESVVGSMVKQHIGAGEPIIRAALVNEKGYLSALIGHNQRAFTIPLDSRSNISGKVLPEDFVDVIVAKREQQSYVADTVVRKVKVLEINGQFDAEAQDESKQKPQSITLEVSPQQAELLAAALREGTPVISLHSMNSDDKGAPVKEAEVKPTEDIVTMIRAGEKGSEVQKIQMKG
jgi:pilus assembly protein CpaB